MRWKTALWTLFVLLLLRASHSQSIKPKSRKDENGFVILPDAKTFLNAHTDDITGSGSGSATDGDNASGIGPDDEDATEAGSGRPVPESTTPSRQLTPCQQLRLGTPNLKNGYVPECTDNGKYKKRQCRGVDLCWCVDPLGQQIIGTAKYGDMKNPRERPDCEGGSNLSPCITLLVKNVWSGLLGTPKPHCTPGGQFMPMQCHERECWCVDDLGRVIDGSGKMKPNLPNCDVRLNRPHMPTERPATKRIATPDNDISLEEHTSKPDNTYNNADKDRVMPGTIDIDSDNNDDDDSIGNESHAAKSKKKNQNADPSPIPLIEQPGILAGIIGGAVVGLLCAILLIMFIVYRVRKKDEGSYALDEPTKARGAYAYQKAPDKEFYA